MVGKILGKRYKEFRIHKAGNYRLPLVKENNNVYSGFNMGAGEKALFELFSAIHECTVSDQPALIIIDEIELGLHEKAQKKLMEVLKELCIPKRLQVLCTTHSPSILESVPPEARFYLEQSADGTQIFQKVTSRFAAGRMAEINSNELDIYVEDETAATILEAVLDLDLRKRLNIFPIGSYNAVCRQLGAAYNHPELRNKSIALLDGDQRGNFSTLINSMAKNMEITIPVEQTKFKDWVKEQLNFMPGKSWPEKWLLSNCLKLLTPDLANTFGTNSEYLKNSFEEALEEEPHSEFYKLSSLLSIKDFERLKHDLTQFLFQANPSLFDTVLDFIRSKLSSSCPNV
ncbi:MAG: hypothetical protein JWQ25_971 [Daejeonella sp.]|nr:hypothetical protein [Daejeonella sp.]